MIDDVHVQPRSLHFDPLSAKARDIQSRLRMYNERQQLLEAMFDRKLLICRGC
jgi:hypothetical protein